MRTVGLLIGIFVCLVVAGIAFAQNERPIPRNAKIFVAEMEGDLDGYLRAEMVKKKLPLQIVLKEEEADLVMVGSSAGDEKRKWHEGWLTASRDHTVGNVMIVEGATGKFLWASEAGDRSVWWGSMKRGGHRKVADRIAHNLKKAIQ